MTAKSSGVTATERMLAEFCGGWPGNKAGRAKALRGGRRWGQFGRRDAYLQVDGQAGVAGRRQMSGLTRRDCPLRAIE